MRPGLSLDLHCLHFLPQYGTWLLMTFKTYSCRRGCETLRMRLRIACEGDKRQQHLEPIICAVGRIDLQSFCTVRAAEYDGLSSWSASAGRGQS